MIFNKSFVPQLSVRKYTIVVVQWYSVINLLSRHNVNMASLMHSSFAIALVVIAISQFSFATFKDFCLQSLKQHYLSGKNDGVENFKIFYNTKTLKGLKENLANAPDYNSAMIAALVLDLFETLIDGNKINLQEKGMTPSKSFCTKKAEYLTEYTDKLTLQALEKSCEVSMRYLQLEDYEDLDDYQDNLVSLYNNQSLDILTYGKLKETKTKKYGHQDEENADEFNFDNFPLAFAVKVTELVNNLEYNDGEFESLDTYCSGVNETTKTIQNVLDKFDKTLSNFKNNQE